MIRKLHEIVDSYFNRAVERTPEQFACAAGCTDCCRVDLSVFKVEADLLKARFDGLPAEVRQAAAKRARNDDHCCMIDPETGKCIVYDARPIICRSHGLTILTDEKNDHCPKNYLTAPADRDCILDIEKLNAALVSVNMAAGGDETRTRIADIAIENS